MQNGLEREESQILSFPAFKALLFAPKFIQQRPSIDSRKTRFSRASDEPISASVITRRQFSPPVLPPQIRSRAIFTGFGKSFQSGVGQNESDFDCHTFYFLSVWAVVILQKMSFIPTLTSFALSKLDYDKEWFAKGHADKRTVWLLHEKKSKDWKKVFERKWAQAEYVTSDTRVWNCFGRRESRTQTEAENPYTRWIEGHQNPSLSFLTERQAKIWCGFHGYVANAWDILGVSRQN